MREHKYKLWDTRDKKMLKFTVGILNTLCNSFSDGRLIFLQYTGLKDKLSHEIYEGDILQRWNNVQKVWENKIIIHSIEDFYFDESHEFNLWGGNEEYQIRGNKYENPELLEKK